VRSDLISIIGNLTEVSKQLYNFIIRMNGTMTSGHSTVNQDAYHIKSGFMFRDINVSIIGIFL